MPTLKLQHIFVNIKRNFCADLKNVDLNNLTHLSDICMHKLSWTDRV